MSGVLARAVLAPSKAARITSTASSVCSAFFLAPIAAPRETVKIVPSTGFITAL